MGALVAESEAERFESTVDNGNDNVDKELGCAFFFEPFFSCDQSQSDV